jgi:hypothetical protein
MATKNQGKLEGTLYAINKTAGKAYRKHVDGEDWESVDPKSIANSSLERAGHEKIGGNWFSVFKTGESEKQG